MKQLSAQQRAYVCALLSAERTFYVFVDESGDIVITTFGWACPNAIFNIRSVYGFEVKPRGLKIDFNKCLHLRSKPSWNKYGPHICMDCGEEF